MRYGARVAVFRVVPLSYALATGTLTLHMHVQVSVLYSSSLPPGQLYRDLPRAQREELRREISNKAALDGAASPAVRVEGSGPDSTFIVHSTEPAKQETIPYVAITTQALAPSLQPLTDWRTATGDTARIVTMDWIGQHYAGVDPANRVRNFIADALARWSTSWVLLGGDTDQVPARMGLYDSYVNVFGPTDLYFSGQNGNWNLDGNAVFGESSDNVDLDPDLFVGRAPVNDAAQTANFVQKVLTYEKSPPAYIDTALLMGVNELSSDSYKQYSILPNLPASYQVVRLYDAASLVPKTDLLDRPHAISYVNQGFHLVNHMDHSGIDSMGTGAHSNGGALTTDDAAGFTNGTKASIVWTYGCDPNAFDYASISESWMNNSMGGAVAFIGDTRTGYASQTSQDGKFFQSWFVDGVGHIGALLAKTQGALFGDYNSKAMNLLGDPAMPVWIHQPTGLTVTGPGVLQTGTNSATITVGNLPVGQEATVTFEKANDNVLVTRQTSSGTITEPLVLHTAGTLHVTARTAERLPWEGSFPVSAAGSHVYVAAVSIDDSAANNDQRLEAGEQVIVKVKLGNGGAVPSQAVAATLTAVTPGATIANPAATVPPLSPGGFATIGFPLAAANSFADGEAVSLDLTAGTTTRIVIPIFAPSLEQTHVYSDSAGNANGIPEPNETIEFKLHVINNGFGDAKGVTAALTTTSSAIALVNASITIGDVAAKSAVDSATAFKLTLAPSFTPSADVLTLSMTDSLGNTTTQPLQLRVPAAPTGLKIRGTAHDIKVIWDAAADHLYRIYRGPANGPYSSIETFLLRDASFYDDTAATSSQIYGYSVRAVDQFGNESAESVKTAVPPLNPDPNFPRSILAADGSISGHIAVYDIDNDGKKEIFALTAPSESSPGKLYAWRADGHELISLPLSDPNFADFASLDGGGIGTPAFAHLHSPQHADIIVNGLSRIYAFHPDGSPVTGWSGGVLIPPITCGSGASPSVFYTSPVIADLDGDGTPEIITTAIDGGESCAGGNAHLYVFKSSGVLQTQYDFPGANYSFGAPAVADLPNGKQEVVFATTRGEIFIIGDSGRTKIATVPNASFTNEVSLGDLDGDHQLDIVVASVSNNRVYAFHTDGTLVNGWQGGIPLDTGDRMVNNFTRSTSIALGDLDCDEKSDVVAVGEKEVYVFRNDGMPMPGWPVFRDGKSGPVTSQASPLIADIDGDGVPDIIVASANKSGEGTIEAWHVVSPLQSPVSHFPIVIDDPIGRTPALADLDGPGSPLKLIAGAGSKLYVWETESLARAELLWPQIYHDPLHTSTMPLRTYVVHDPLLCQVARIACHPPEIFFSDACGCGCVKLGN
ncbi:MAG TPA: C25 family cysteine peptidase [Thermoanaerobaculia bacterium]|nr:C25 family cysteine peptidase [Thermoanaerobaculia bacterium]